MNKSAELDCVRTMAIGAEVLPHDGVHFRVWAPKCKRVDVVLHPPTGPSGRATREIHLSPEADGYFSEVVAEAGAGTRYEFRLNGKDLYPDPASRFQPEGPFGPSQVVDPGAFDWTDGAWAGVHLPGQVFYELHVGTFTPAGTWEAARRQLKELASVGITLIELMPIADYAGRFNWGYDGVNLFAPSRNYGTPDDFRRFVDAAHATGIAVILDVVDNHFGSVGCFHRQFSDDYFTDRHKTEWGAAINFDGDHAPPVREYFLANTAYWIREFHLDGLRIDATQAFFDDSPRHILAELTETARSATGSRSIIVAAESEPQQTIMVRPADKGGYGMDAAWNDDFHHSALVRLTGHNEAYFSDYLGTPEEFVAAAKWGYLYQGQRYSWQKKPRGTPTFGLPSPTFINYLENHDQLANSGFGKRVRLRTSPGRWRAMTALLLLGPGTPLLFQGQEFGATSPFLYFADNDAEQAQIIATGRKKFLSQFPSLARPAAQERLPDPADPATFDRCKLDFTERERHAEIYQLHKDLLRLRRDDPVIRQQDSQRLEGAALSGDALILRMLGDDGDDRLLIVNFGIQLNLRSVPQPLLAPPADTRWDVLWSSEEPVYGGLGTPPVDTEQGWRIPGEAAVVLRPIPVDINSER